MIFLSHHNHLVVKEIISCQLRNIKGSALENALENKIFSQTMSYNIATNRKPGARGCKP